MFLVALVPSLWFRVMDPLLLAHTEGKPERINFDPRRRAALCARYGLEDAQALEESEAATRAAA
jgi:alkane 1-monooxygenase